MKRHELEHVIRAAAANADVTDIVVIGSQAILGSLPDAPPELTESVEADVFPLRDAARSIVIDGAMGELSLFHQTFGYYAHGVDESTAILPTGWRSRLVRLQNENTRGAVGWCLEVHDLAVSKLAAAREKDFAFVDAMFRAGVIATDTLTERLDNTPDFPESLRPVVAARLAEWGHRK